jgi:hypothetical protein
MDNYEYKVQYRTSGSEVWLDCRVLTNIINARVYKRQSEALHRTTKFRIVRRPKEWEVCE